MSSEKCARNRKLSPEAVSQIRGLLSMGVRSNRIAQDYGVSSATISKIKNNKAWNENVLAGTQSFLNSIS